MPDGPRTLTSQTLKTPRAAALAGILFAVLLSSSVVLIRLSIPANPEDGGVWLQERAGIVTLALSLLPFAGIAFLWFIGVVRDRLGRLEDQFFSTVFFGSGLLFLAMIFASAAIVGGTLAAYAVEPRRLIDSGVYTFARTVDVPHHQRLCHQDGWGVHDLTSHHLGAYTGHAALAGTSHLCAGAGAAAQHQL